MPSLNLDRIEAILRLLRQQPYVGELTVEGDGWRVQARSGASVPLPQVQTPAPVEETPAEEQRHSVRAGMVGIYRAPKQPIRPGSFIDQDAIAGNIDSMRILNPVTVDESGYVVAVLVEDGDPVEYGQELLVLSPGQD
ncbi:MAG TPA: biotin/lipoyl-containing protein [Armatimonadota bacterium]|nr:biotin/lipoyl-containing protein [Armatimonadota bacterium]